MINTTSPAAGTETVQAFFDTATTPPCAKVGAGDTLVYSVTNPGGETKTITLTLIGAAADAEHQFDPHSLGNVCFESPSSFLTNANVQSTNGRPTASSSATCPSATTRTATTTRVRWAHWSCPPAPSRASISSTPRKDTWATVHAR